MEIIVSSNLNNKKIKRDIILGRFAEELYDELLRMGYIERMNQVSQLGTIKVPKNQRKSRYEYMCLQLYIHDVLKKQAVDKTFEYTYGSKIKSHELGLDDIKLEGYFPTVLDVIQITIMVSNIGHFENTFAANKGIIEACMLDEVVEDWMIRQFSEENQDIIRLLITDKNYMQLNLGVSLLMLQKCNVELKSIKLAQQIIKDFILKSTKSKLNYAFEIFKNVRNLSFYAYDLPISMIPLRINVASGTDICTIFKELQNKYNNTVPARKLFESIAKLLGDTVYNRPSYVISQYETVSKKIRNELIEHIDIWKDFMGLLLDRNSLINRNYSLNCNYDKENILKLTFDSNELNFYEVFQRVERMNYVRAGYYYRGNGRNTMLIALDKKSDVKSALNVLRYLISVLRKKTKNNDEKELEAKYINITRFFLYVLFERRKVEIKPSNNMVLYVAKGRKQRLKGLENVITNDRDDDLDHELCLVRDYLALDNMNDTAIVIGGSIVVMKDKERDNIEKNQVELNEYDGLVIYPYRKENQVVFFEAKNKKNRDKSAKGCLIEKLNNVHILYDEGDIKTVNKDCYYEYTI